MASNSRQMLKSANPSTIQNKFMVGYQGWFTCPGDGEPVGPGHHGWLHWFNYPIPDGGRPNTDVWPDVSSYAPSELFPAPGLKTISGEQTFLFSSRNAKTVQRHFHWMAEHGVDGAFLQRFAGQCDLESGNQGIMRIRDEVGERVREAAEREGRVFAIMYDVSGVPADRIQRILERDWIHLVHELGVLDSPNYLKEKGKPVIALWGFGFEHAGHTPALVRAITQFFRNNTPGGVYIMGGTPTHWRTGEGDADRNPEFLQVWLNEFDAISPWTIGRYSTEQEADNFAKTKMKSDWELITNRNQEGNTRKVDYIPVVLPGGSGYNLSEGKWSFNGIKRQGGRFLWKQIYNAHGLGVNTIYGAMWDEYDEGTAFMPIVEHKRNLPVSDKYQFLSLDEDGFDVPSDWYMRICGFAAEGLRNERRIHETFPVKELQDYWSSRPRYEEVNPNSKEFRSGSLLSNKSDDVGEGPGEGGQTYQEWLALQKDDKEEVPPPPYTLEDDEPIPSQTVTNSDIGSSTVAMTAEVPVRNLPTVANVQPPVSSTNQAVAPPAVNTNTYHAGSSSHAVPSSSIPSASPPAVNTNTYHAGSSTHAIPSSSIPSVSPPPAVNMNTYPAPASRQEAYSQVSAQSLQPSYPPAQGHSPGGVHRPQSVSPSPRHSPQPYPPGVSQHPQSHLPSSPHADSGQPMQSYPPHTGPQQPYQAQTFQPYPPTSGQVPVWGQPQPYPQSGSLSYQGYSPTGHPQGYPSPGAPPPVAQSYSTSGSPVHQGYPPVDVQGYPSNHNTGQTHGQSQDPVAALANDFGRQSISSPSGVSTGGRLPTPPPLHPSRPTRVSTKPNSPSGVAGGRLPSPPPLHPAHPNRPPSASLKPSSRPQSHATASPSVSSSSGQATSTNRPRWPPADWDSDTPPVQQQFSGRRPSSHGHVGETALRPTSSMSARPSRHDTNMPSAAYVEPTHGHSNDSFSFPTGPAKYEQYVAFPSGPQYNSPYMTSSYPDQQGGSWPETGRPPTFPVSPMAYGVPESPYGSAQYSGGPTFPSIAGGGSEGMHFPEGPGGSYFDGSSSSSSSSYPAPWTSTSGESPGRHGGKHGTLRIVDRIAGRVEQSRLFHKLK